MIPSRMARTVLLTLAVAAAPLWSAPETPASYGEASSVDTPIVRIPMTTKAPTIDGVMEKGEWQDASALSGFWYDFGQADFRFLAPMQTNLQVYLCYDAENIYVCYTSPVYPEKSWLRSRGRFTDVYMHPQYGLIWDDHLELELRPYHDNVQAFRMGLFKWFVNPIGTMSDQYWTVDGGDGRKWQSKARVVSKANETRWIVEWAIPMAEMVVGHYKETDAEGKPQVVIPPPDGTTWRCWFTRAIGGNGGFFNAWDMHCWNTTKTRLVFDSKAPSFQLNELGPVMEDQIDVTMTVKNHNTRSEMVRLGFFVESAEGTIYSSYQAPELTDGLLELVPGETKTIRLRQAFPGISRNGNVLWFDVRSAGDPARVLFRTRLMRFHSMEGGEVYNSRTGQMIPFRKRRVEVINRLRPPRKDFGFDSNYDTYTRNVSAVVDLGLNGASDEAKTAVEAKILVLRADQTEKVIAEMTQPIRDNFACFVLPVPELTNGEAYRVSCLLFDKDKRIVGEENPEPFTFHVEPWQGNKIGLDDVVWEPFIPIRKTPDGFETLKHQFTIAPSGLPAQVYIRPDPRELPLEKREPGLKIFPAELTRIGRGDQFRSPMRLEAVIGGQRVAAEVVEPAKVIRQWKSEIQYASKLKIGPLLVSLDVQYDCDGTMQVKMDYGPQAPADIELLELVSDVAGTVDMCLSAIHGGGMTGGDKWDLTLPMKEGMVFDGLDLDGPELRVGRFVPWFWFGSPDRAWSFFCDNDKDWVLDREGTCMTLERDKNMQVTWRVKLVNHPARLEGTRHVDFTVLTHPAKSKPADFRKIAWFYCGPIGDGYGQEPIILSEEYLKRQWRKAASAPADWPWEKAREWRKQDPPWYRFGQWRNVGVCKELDQTWEDKATYYFEQHVRIGRRCGWWMDEYWPIGFGGSNNLASGNAYLREPDDVKEGELPWQRCFLTRYMRGHYKRLARVMATENVPQRQCGWANNEATMLESFMWDTHLVEECGGGHRSYEIDLVTQFPLSSFRYWAHNYTGLITRYWMDVTPSASGDDPQFERTNLGLCLSHDYGHTPSGPHDSVQHPEEYMRVIHDLLGFGFFDPNDIEMLPYWRNGDVVRYGPAYQEGGSFNIHKSNPYEKVLVTCFRRPLREDEKDNRHRKKDGYKVLFVVFNASDEDVRDQLFILDPTRLFGGSNQLTDVAALSTYDMKDFPPNSDWTPGAVRSAINRYTHGPSPEYAPQVLLDVEDKGIVRRRFSRDEGEVYGRLFVPRHDFRLLVGQGYAGEVRVERQRTESPAQPTPATPEPEPGPGELLTLSPGQEIPALPSRGDKRRVEIMLKPLPADHKLQVKITSGFVAELTPLDAEGKPDGNQIYYRNEYGSPAKYVPYVHGVLNGLERHLEDRQTVLEIPWVEGKVHGVRRAYHPNGKLQNETPFDHGVESGLAKSFNVDGKLVRQTPYVNGQRQGEMIDYWPDTGRPMRVVTYDKGLAQGVAKSFYADGTIKWERSFKDNQLHGIEKQYNSKGELDTTRYWLNDKEVTQAEFEATKK